MKEVSRYSHRTTKYGRGPNLYLTLYREGRFENTTIRCDITEKNYLSFWDSHIKSI